MDGAGGPQTVDHSVTIVFTDIVASTTLTAELGDRAWAEAMREHGATVAGIARSNVCEGPSKSSWA